jgi:hypothetical protein
MAKSPWPLKRQSLLTRQEVEKMKRSRWPCMDRIGGG